MALEMYTIFEREIESFDEGGIGGQVSGIARRLLVGASRLPPTGSGWDNRGRGEKESELLCRDSVPAAWFRRNSTHSTSEVIKTIKPDGEIMRTLLIRIRSRVSKHAVCVVHEIL